MSTSDDEERESHPSYGLARFSRVQGNPGRLFGSALPNHESYISLSIGSAERIHSLGRDTYYGSIRGDKIEVMFSAAQFAELLTTLNIGFGVPCTIQYLNGAKVESPPDVPVEVEKIRTSFKKDMNDLASKCKKDVKDVEDLLKKKNLTQADRALIQGMLEKVMMQVEANIPFVLAQFEKATEKVVQHAKAEVDAFVTSSVMAEGLRSLQEKKDADTKELVLESKNSDGE